MSNELIMEMIAKLVSEEVLAVLQMKEFDFEKYISSKSVAIANEVHEVLDRYPIGDAPNEVTDFQAIEEIVGIYEKYGFSGGSIHDF